MFPALTQARERGQTILARLREIKAKADAGEDLSRREIAEAKKLHAEGKEVADEIEELQKLEKVGERALARGHAEDGTDLGPAGSGRKLSDVLARQGWSLGKTASIPTSSNALIDDPDEAAPRREPGIERELDDSRYLFPHLPSTPSGDATSIEAVVSTGRVLSADVKPIASTDEKLVTESATVLQTFPMQRAATVSDFYPNAIVGLQAFRDLVDSDMTDAYRAAIDAYVIAALEAAAGTTDNTGVDLFEQIRKAVTSMQGKGLAPNLVALPALDAESLDLERTSEGLFVLPPSPRDEAFSPLWKMRAIVVAGLTDPILLDSRWIRFFIGNAAFAADGITQFSTNQSRFRLESPVLVVPRQADAIHVVAAAI